MARVYADVNQQMPRSYWDYDSVNITWGVLENYEVVRKIGKEPQQQASPHVTGKLPVNYHQQLITRSRNRPGKILRGF